jgi:arylsulfatase A-like enzyme
VADNYEMVWGHRQKVGIKLYFQQMFGIKLNTMAMILSILSASGVALGAETHTKSASSLQPNIILVFTDDQGYADLGVFGASDIRTPNLDKMAAEGIRFMSFYAQPVCGPSRAALLTGSYPIRVAEPGNTKSPNTVPHSKEITIAEGLKTAGYATAVIGKWHMAGEGLEPWDFAPPPVEPGRPGGLGPFNPELMPNAQGFDYFFGTPMHNGYTELVDNRRFIVQLMRNSDVVESPADVNLLTKKYTEETIKFIRQHKDRPFFIYLSHNMPHVSLGASEAFRGKSPRGLYGDAIEELDWSMGQILEELKRQQLEQNTLIVFTSDNGPETQANLGGNNGRATPLRGGKYSNWEGGVRVPAIMQWQGKIPKGVVSKEIATTMDLFPTFMKLASGALPEDRVIDGKDISALLFAKAGAQSPHHSFYYYSLTKLQAVRSGRWKLVLPRKVDSPHILWLSKYMDAVEKPMLFDLELDISEQHNLAAKRPDVVTDLMIEVERARTELGDYNRIGTGARFFDKGPKRPHTYFPEE